MKSSDQEVVSPGDAVKVWLDGSVVPFGAGAYRVGGEKALVTY